MRNPMHVGVLTLVTGRVLYLGSVLLGIYAVALVFGFHLRVVLNEDPWLAERFGDAWQASAREVRRWWPRLSPWWGRG
jgi:protein-S-isoprenylcysteine O-methyltransferase Ste14